MVLAFIVVACRYPYRPDKSLPKSEPTRLTFECSLSVCLAQSLSHFMQPEGLLHPSNSQLTRRNGLHTTRRRKGKSREDGLAPAEPRMRPMSSFEKEM